MTDTYTKFIFIIVVYFIILYFIKKNKKLSQLQNDIPSVIVTYQAKSHTNTLIESFPELEFNKDAISFYCLLYELLILTDAALTLGLSEEADKTVGEVIADKEQLEKYYKERAYFTELKDKYIERFYNLIQTDINGNSVTPDGFFDIRRKMKFIFEEEKLYASSFKKYLKAQKNYYADESGVSI